MNVTKDKKADGQIDRKNVRKRANSSQHQRAEACFCEMILFVQSGFNRLATNGLPSWVKHRGIFHFVFSDVFVFHGMVHKEIQDLFFASPEIQLYSFIFLGGFLCNLFQTVTTPAEFS